MQVYETSATMPRHELAQCKGLPLKKPFYVSLFSRICSSKHVAGLLLLGMEPEIKLELVQLFSLHRSVLVIICSTQPTFGSLWIHVASFHHCLKPENKTDQFFISSYVFQLQSVCFWRRRAATVSKP